MEKSSLKINWRNKRNLVGVFVGLIIISIIVALLINAAKSHKYSFKTSQDAIMGCREMLADLETKNSVDAKELVKIIEDWQEIQDSSYSVFSRDSDLKIHSEPASQYFLVSDSIRKNINRLAFEHPRGLSDVIYIKINGAPGRNKIRNSPEWKKANDFYDELDKADTYGNAKETMTQYAHLLDVTKDIKNEKQLLVFIKEEDKCFRSMLNFLGQIPQSYLQNITTRTGDIFNRMYGRVGVKKDSINDLTMLYLTLRFNRRILQNAQACQRDIENGQKLSKQMAANYRWMLLQPFVTIDNYSVACLTNSQAKEMMQLSEKLPSSLAYLDGGENNNREQREKMINLLSNYFLKNFMLTTI